MNFKVLNGDIDFSNEFVKLNEIREILKKHLSQLIHLKMNV